MFEGEKTSVFWVGLFILGLAFVYLCLLTWVSIGLYRDWGLHTVFELYLPEIVGAVFFHLIGLYMMKSGVKKRGSGKGEKATVFWVGLIILGCASLFLFDIVWNEVVIYKIYRYEPINLPTITGTIVFILIGLYMMKSVKGERTAVFWVGLIVLIILGLVSVVLVRRLWPSGIDMQGLLTL
jgi:xanthine/uracil permease